MRRVFQRYFLLLNEFDYLDEFLHLSTLYYIITILLFDSC